MTALQQEKLVTDYGKSLARIDVEIANTEMAQRVSRNLGDEHGYTENTKQLVQLRKDRAAIQEKSDHADKEAEELEECQDLIGCATQTWDVMPVGNRKRLVKLIVESANLLELSPHFVKLDVVLSELLLNNSTISLHLYRARGSKYRWGEEEDTLLAEMFPTADKEALMEALPNHSWSSICFRGWEKLKLRRNATKQDVLTWTDFQVMKQYGARIDAPIWTTQYKDYDLHMKGLKWWYNRERVLYIIR